MIFSLFSLSVIFSLLIVATRLGILLIYGSSFTTSELLGVLIGIPNEFAIGLFVSYLIIRYPRSKFVYIPSFLIIALIIFLKILCFHYEAVFGNLPGASVLYYLSELKNLNSSLKFHLPIPNIILEFILTYGIYFYIWLRLRFKKHRDTYKTPIIIGTLTVYLFVILIQIYPSVIPDRYFQQSREALLWLIRSNFINKQYNVDTINISQEDINRFFSFIGHEKPGPLINDQYPLCRIKTGVNNTNRKKKNIIILILESVGYKEMYGTFEGKELMPELHRIANENLSFGKIKAAGTKSAQGLPAIFSGLLPQPFTNYLWTSPLIHFQGFPQKLKQEDYKTVYLHGSDLTFEHQRQYLKEAGFDELDEYNNDSNQKAYGWGYDDRTMFNKLKAWITKNGKAGNNPYLATLFTLSTHDPYLLPPDWQPVFSGQLRVLKDISKCCEIEGESNSFKAMADTYRFLDTQLSDFYTWYKQNTTDTLLIMVGDHSPPLDLYEVSKKPYQGRFDVPLIIAGLDKESVAKYRKYKDRIGAQYDIPATVMSLLGYPPIECDLGTNLLTPDDEWPRQRYVYAMGGDSSQYIQIWHDGNDISFDRTDDRYYINRTNKMAKFNRKDLELFLNTMLSTHYYMLKNDAYSIHASTKSTQHLSSVSMPIFVAHRGNTGGTPENKYIENSLTAFDNVKKSGMDWVEVDVNITRDGVPVLLHDEYIETASGNIPINKIVYSDLLMNTDLPELVRLEDFINKYSDSLNMLIEIKNIDNVREYLHITREISKIIENRAHKNRIIIDSFNEFIPASIKAYCDCETGYDLPFMKKPDQKDLQYAKRMKFDWIYLHYSVVDASLIKAAHKQGLKVMAYTVNDSDIVNQWKETELPDGIITDNVEVFEKFSKK